MPRLRFLPVALSAFAILALTIGLARSPHSAPPVAGGAAGMTDASMRQWLATWYGAHPAHGGATVSGTPADTFLVSSFRFDTDGNGLTQVDTARVVVGQIVLFKWVGGFHTTTSGNPGDPDAGSHWDHPIDSSNLEFAVQFDTLGTYPFFCRPHGATFNMRGVVIVSQNALGVAPALGTYDRAGFTQGAWPNPTRGGANFRFAIARSGRVTLRVVDLNGRLVTTVLDAPLAAGTYAGTWNGRLDNGTNAPAGVYYARLLGPGLAASERVVLTR